MPYRRLPKTDAARLKALKIAIEKGERDGIYSQVMTQRSQNSAKVVLANYERTLYEYKQAVERNMRSAREMQKNVQKARMYISHFIQVLNLCVIRGEISKEQKKLYGLEPESNTVPDMSSEKRVVEWGRKIIRGETQRQQHGGVPLYNPNIAKVKVFFDPFESGIEDQRIQKLNILHYLEKVEKNRAEADRLLLEIWNQVERFFDDLPEDEKMEKCRQYGIVYYYRRGEKPKAAENAGEPENEQSDIFSAV